MKKIITLLYLIGIVSAASANDFDSTIWRGIIQLNDGELPFNFLTNTSNGKPFLEIHNGEERIRVDEITISGDSIFIRMPVFDSEFRVKTSGTKWEGQFFNHARATNNIFPFTAIKGESHRFISDSDAGIANISGTWNVTFSPGTADSSKAVGVFSDKSSHITATFLTTTGDYRYLEGITDGNRIKMSAFDGSHLFLFQALLLPDGSINGFFYSGNHWHERWIAVKDDKAKLPDPYSITSLNPGFKTIDFTFRDLNGNNVSLSDAQFKNKVVIVDIMGSWCPNCMDETSFLSGFYKDYHKKGVEVIDLCFERFNDFAKFQYNLSRLKEKYGIEYPILFAGVLGDESTAKTLPAVKKIEGYPTTFFIGKDGEVKSIYTGISGPATGNGWQIWKDDFTTQVNKLLVQ